MLHYMRDGTIMYLCITDDVRDRLSQVFSISNNVFVSMQEFERSKAFLFLSDIRKRFVE